MTDSIKVMTGGYGYTTIDDMDAKIDAARLEGIRLGLEAAEQAIKALFSTGDTPLEAMALVDASKAVRALNPNTIAQEADNEPR